MGLVSQSTQEINPDEFTAAAREKKINERFAALTTQEKYELFSRADLYAMTDAARKRQGLAIGQIEEILRGLRG